MDLKWRIACVATWMIPASLAIFERCRLGRLGADILGQYRYTTDLVAALTDGIPFAWVMQEGPRFFPDFIISLLAFLLAFGEPSKWGLIFAFANLTLLYASLVFFLATFRETEHSRHLIATTFMLSCLACAAVSEYFSTALLAPTHHNSLLPFCVLFYASARVCCQQTRFSTALWLVLGFSLVFGLVIHSDALFLVWAVGPLCMAVFLLCLFWKTRWRQLKYLSGILVLSLGVAALVGVAVRSIPFIAIKGGSPLSGFPGGIDEVWSRMGTATNRISSLEESWFFLILVAVASFVSIYVIWRSQILDADRREIGVFIGILFLTTFIFVPVVMVLSDSVSRRYSFYIFMLSNLTIATNLPAILGNGHLSSGRVRVGIVSLLFLVSTPTLGYKALDPKPRFPSLFAELDRLRGAGMIGDSGLANYWLAHPITAATGFHVGAVTRDLKPRFHSDNLYLYWKWEDGCPLNRNYSFIITSKSPRHRNSPKQISSHFGTPAEIVYVHDKEEFEIWLYPDGIENETRFYDVVKSLASRFNLGLVELRRCGLTS